MSDVKINLTQPQYFALLALASSIPKILDLSELNQDSTHPKPVSNLAHPNSKSEVSKPRLIQQSSHVSSTSNQAAVAVWVTMELAFTVTSVTLELFDATITPSETERNNSLAKFSLTGIRAFSNTKSDGSMKAEMLLKALRTIDTRAWKATKFREIVPVAEHDSDQLALSYKQTEAYSSVNLELDSPNLILSLDFLFAIQAFLTDSRSHVNPAATESPQDLSKSTPSGNQAISTFHYSVNVIRPKLTIISDPEKSDSDSVHLIIEKFSVNQQQVLTAMVIDMCMSLGTMNDLQNDVKFLDACTMSFSLTDVPQDGHNQVSMHAHTTPLILRLSYRDFLLVYSVYCKALDFSQVDPSDKQTAQEPGFENKDLLPRSPSVLSSSSPTPTHTPEKVCFCGLLPYIGMITNDLSFSKLSVLIDKIQVVLIGDLHEQPLLDFHTRNFELIASNWSHEVRCLDCMGSRTALIKICYVSFHSTLQSHLRSTVSLVYVIV
jgi:vacuolar protein sorting-associated protein 13A/C